MAGIAASLGLGVDDLDFVGLAFYQGSDFSIANEFDMGSLELSSARGGTCVRFDLRIPPAPGGCFTPPSSGVSAVVHPDTVTAISCRTKWTKTCVVVLTTDFPSN